MARGDSLMTWEPEIEELRQREALAEKLGGADKVERQHFFGKLTIRERIDAIADLGSLHEIGKTAGVASYGENGELVDFMPSNFVFGIARIDGRPVIVSGDDFTVRGGSADASIGEKRDASEAMALEMRIPHVRLVDGMGGGGSVKVIEQNGYVKTNWAPGWENVVDHLAVAPSVSLALGSVAGIGAARVTTAHYSVIVRDTAQMMIAGPALVDWASLGDVTKEELGHADIHTRNGAIDDVADSEADAFEMAKRFLSYLPSNVDELPPRAEPSDDPDRRDESLISIVPRDQRKVYKMRVIIEAVTDKDSFFEIGRSWGKSIITGLARLDGYPCLIFAEDPYVYGGGWTADACRKLIRMVDLASTFHLPVIHLQDCPGFVIGKEAEENATIRVGSTALAALRQLKAPYACVIIRKSYGVAGTANRQQGTHSYRCSWPSGDWGSLPMEGGIEVAYKAELEGAQDREELLGEIRARLNKVRSPHRSAEKFSIEELIDPRKTRPILCEWIGLAQSALRPGEATFSYRP
jgi:acetyl-CoA carboxylase carboxyltransferase component